MRAKLDEKESGVTMERHRTLGVDQVMVAQQIQYYWTHHLISTQLSIIILWTLPSPM